MAGKWAAAVSGERKLSDELDTLRDKLPPALIEKWEIEEKDALDEEDGNMIYMSRLTSREHSTVLQLSLRVLSRLAVQSMADIRLQLTRCDVNGGTSAGSVGWLVRGINIQQEQ